MRPNSDEFGYNGCGLSIVEQLSQLLMSVCGNRFLSSDGPAVDVTNQARERWGQSFYNGYAGWLGRMIIRFASYVRIPSRIEHTARSSETSYLKLADNGFGKNGSATRTVRSTES